MGWKFIVHRIKTTALLLCMLGVGIFSLDCAGTKPEDDRENIAGRFDRGMEFLEKKRYLRAQEEFNQVAIQGGHTEYGDDAQFYLAEAYYLNKEYLLAISEYERLVRRMPFSPFVESARYRICESLLAESPLYFHDQSFTLRAIEKLQEFIDDYPDSKHTPQAAETIYALRDKLGKKAFETGVLYVKLAEYQSAQIAFQEVISEYYDTNYYEPALVGIIQTYCLRRQVDEAQAYYEAHVSGLKTAEYHRQARQYIQDARQELSRLKK